MDRAKIVRDFARRCAGAGIPKNRVNEGFANVLRQLATLDPPLEDPAVCAILDRDELLTVATTRTNAEQHIKTKHGSILSTEWFYYMGH